jgi:alpha/beta superfamily hydrolase
MALIGARRDEFCEPARFEALYLSLPATPWVRVLDTDHFFGAALDDLAQSCRDANAWVARGGETNR